MQIKFLSTKPLVSFLKVYSRSEQIVFWLPRTLPVTCFLSIQEYFFYRNLRVYISNMVLKSVTQSREAWHLLQGVGAVYKFPGISQSSALGRLKYDLSEDLSSMERVVERDSEEQFQLGEKTRDTFYPPGQSQSLQSSTFESEVANVDIDGRGRYSVSPLVLGPGYLKEDVRVKTVNNLDEKVSGVMVCGFGREGCFQARKLCNLKLPTSYSVSGELGRATDTGWVSGKTRMKKSWRHLNARPWVFENCLSAISTQQSKKIWSVSDVSPDTEEGYSRACQGLIKPDILSEPLVYSIECSNWKPPHFSLNIVAVEPLLKEGLRQSWLLTLVQEIGIKCKTVAQIHKIRCVSVGPWGPDQALLAKHCNLQNVLDNIASNREAVDRLINEENSEQFKSNINVEEIRGPVTSSKKITKSFVKML